MKYTTKLFKGKKVRAVWDSTHKKWWVSVVDICAAVCGSGYDAARNYWKQHKYRLLSKNSPITRILHQIKMTAKDGKLRFTDVMDYKKIVQLIQSLPQERAKVFKAWLGSIAARHCNLLGQLDMNKNCTMKGANELIRVKTTLIFKEPT